MKYLILKLNNQTHALKDRDTICASLNDYMTVEAIKSNIGEESEIDIRANGNLLIPGRTILMSIPNIQFCSSIQEPKFYLFLI